MESTEFTEYFLALRNSVLRLAKRIMHSEKDAEDVVSDIYEKFLSNPNVTERYDNLQGAIMTSTRNLCYDRLKKAGRHRELNKTIFRARSCTPPEEYGGYVADIMEDLIDSLPEKQRMAVRLRDIECMEFSQIASVTGMSESSVRVCLCRGRNTLRQKMEKIMNHGVR